MINSVINFIARAMPSVETAIIIRYSNETPITFVDVEQEAH